MKELFEKYDRLFLFDTETTGLSFSRDEIIQFSAVVLERRNGVVETTRQYDNLVTLSPGGSVPPKIQQLTGITDLDILERGISKEQLFRDIAELVAGDTLLLMDQLCDEKNTDEIWTERVALGEAIEKLGERERKILYLRYYEGKTQTEISEEVGISQAQVSRLEKNALQNIKLNIS